MALFPKLHSKSVIGPLPLAQRRKVYLSTYDILNQGIDFCDWSKTRSLCDQILQEHPGDPDALVARARLRSLVGRTRDALSDCEQVLAMSPRFAPALNISYFGTFTNEHQILGYLNKPERAARFIHNSW